MNRLRSITLGLCLLGAMLVLGCAWRADNEFSGDGDCYAVAATELEYPDVASCRTEPIESQAPLSLSTTMPTEYWDLTLEESVQLALMNSQILRDLGGTVLRNPTAAPTVYGPALRETDPRAGVEAALSAFDAQLATSALFEKNDRALNNEILGGGTRLLKQDIIAWQTELRKRSAVGTEMIARHTTDYDANNAPGNLFPSAWNTAYEVEVRQPWLQGAGLDFNRIAGGRVVGEDLDSNRVPGLYTGVLIARVNTDIELAEFERAVRDEVSNIENAYWDLYYAYRDLDAKIAARDAALETWRRIRALYDTGRVGGEADKEAQAREQYFRFQEEVQNSLSGRLLDGTRTNNGSSGGSFRATSGVHVAERRLRLLLGVTTTDGRLIRPASEPVLAPIAFDWTEAVTEALARRVELRKQRWEVKRRELELLASRNYLLPRLDTFGRYRWRGFGNDLISANGGKPRFDNAYADLVSGDFQEWGLGIELSMPLGFRRGHAAVRNANLQLARERAVLDEQERQVLYGLSNVTAELDRAFTVSKTAYNRRMAAHEQLAAVEAAYNERPDLLDRLLDAQRRVADSESRYHQLLVEYALAVKNVHFEKGSLLDHAQVHLAEGPWPGKAYHDAARREKLRGPERAINYAFTRDRLTVSRGPVAQASVRAVEEIAVGTVEDAAPAPLPSQTDEQPAEADNDRAAASSRRMPQAATASAAEPPLPAAQRAEPKVAPAASDAEQGPLNGQSATKESIATIPPNTQQTKSDAASGAPANELLSDPPLPTVTPVTTKTPVLSKPKPAATPLTSNSADRPTSRNQRATVPAHLDPSAAWPGSTGVQLSGANGEIFVEEVATTRQVPTAAEEFSMPRPDLEANEATPEDILPRSTREKVEAEPQPEPATTTRMATPEFEVPAVPSDFYQADSRTQLREREPTHPLIKDGTGRGLVDRRQLGRDPQVWNRQAATAARESNAITRRIEVAESNAEAKPSDGPAAKPSPADKGLGKQRRLRR